MKSRRELSKELLEILEEHPQRYKEDYERLKEIEKGTEAYYQGEPVAFLYTPCFLREEELTDLRNLVHEATALFDRVFSLYFEEEKFRELFGFSKRAEELILLGSPLPRMYPMARMDIFYRGLGDYSFCEINTDGSSAMNEDRVLSELFMESELWKTLEERGYEVSSFELFESWVETVYKYWKKQEPPVVAILDTQVDSDEFRRYARHFEKRGAKVFLVTPWELDLQDGYLSYQDEKIDLIYRRLVTTDLLEIYDEVPKLIEGIGAGKTLFFGPLASQILHNKMLFSVLHDPKAKPYFTQEQHQWIQAHIPFTAKVDEAVLSNELYVYHKDRYLLKPMDSYASRGIFVGKNTSEADWRNLLEAVTNRDYLIQEFAVLPSFVSMDYDYGEICDFNHLMGLFVYDGELKGFFSRAGRGLVIAGHAQGRSQATLLLRKKAEIK